VTRNREPGAAFRLALTFDVEHPDRPSIAGVTESILESLERDGVLATMFVQGRWAEAYPAVAALIGRGGHRVGNHSFYHARSPLLTGDGFVTDVQTAEAVIRAACGVDPRPWFRCPFGTGMDDGKLLAVLGSLGYRNVGWDVDSLDWDEGDAADLIDRVVRETLATGDGAVVLLHGWPRRTAEALPAIVARLRDAGAQFVTVDALRAPTQGFPQQQGLEAASGHGSHTA
jgi:peptidoglycan/xylan/chitin deacetylase (PgdA/CDA1 family)